MATNSIRSSKAPVFFSHSSCTLLVSGSVVAVAGKSVHPCDSSSADYLPIPSATSWHPFAGAQPILH